ncbi:MAG: right-handed parallel beta-helix repeat-containing protein [Thermoplasmata archaeon]|nr:right-handed parallel beta-helix repeat-containing protein [Thermoplasmata archaeon]
MPTKGISKHPLRFLIPLTAAIGLLVLMFLLLSQNTGATTISVEEDESGKYTSLRYALENASDGDTILVGPGNYSGSFKINNSVTLRSREGPERTFISPEYHEKNGTYHIVTGGLGNKLILVNASNVTIEGFTFSALPTNIELNNTTVSSYIGFIYFIYFDGKEGLTVLGNDLVAHPNSSISEESSKHVRAWGIAGGEGIISRVIVENNSAEHINRFLILGDADGVMVRNNTIRNGEWALEFRCLAYSRIEKNQISGHIMGIQLGWFNHRLDIENNTFHSNKWDINIEANLIESSIIGNTFEVPLPGDYWDISLSVASSHSFLIEGNTFRNRSQVILNGADNLTITNNTLVSTDLQMDGVSNIKAENNTIDGRALVILGGESNLTYSLAHAGRVFVVGSYDLTLKDIAIEDAGVGVKIIRSNNVRIQNSLFGNSSTAGVYIVDSMYCGIISSNFSCGYYGVFIQSSNGCYVTGSNFSGNFIGIRLKESDLTSIMDSHFSGGKEGIDLDHAYIGNVARCEFSGMDYGIKTRVAKRFYLTSNNFSNVTLSGIQLFGGNSINVGNNTIMGGVAGVEFLSSPGGVVEGNTISGFSGYGIALNNTSGGARVAGNRIHGRGDTGCGLFILVSNENNITGNNISMTGYGIYLENSTKNNFTDNMITRNIHGVYLVSMVYSAFFENNTISKNTRGADAENAKGMVDMSWNYWGAETGPYHPENNSRSPGDEVSDNIVFLPFQRYRGEIREGQSPAEEEKFIWDLTRSQFLILVIDLAIILGVGGLIVVGILGERKKDNDNH